MLNAERVRFDRYVEQLESSEFKNRIIRYFPDTFLGNGHEGLSKIAQSKGINVRELKSGEYVIFVNKNQTGLKLFAPGNIIAYLKMPGKTRINPNVIPKIPRFFNGSEIKYDKALRETIEKEFRQRNKY